MVLGGIELARSGDELVERAGLSRVLVGSLLMATATSLTEVATGVSAALRDAPDLAVGDQFGGAMANMAILAIIDLGHRKQVWPSEELGRARVASITIGLTALAALGVLTPPACRSAGSASTRSCSPRRTSPRWRGCAARR